MTLVCTAVLLLQLHLAKKDLSVVHLGLHGLMFKSTDPNGRRFARDDLAFLLPLAKRKRRFKSLNPINPIPNLQRELLNALFDFVCGKYPQFVCDLCFGSSLGRRRRAQTKHRRPKNVGPPLRPHSLLALVFLSEASLCDAFPRASCGCWRPRRERRV